MMSSATPVATTSQRRATDAAAVVVPSPRAREIGYDQCADALRRTLVTTPAGWALVGWLAWHHAPTARLVAWVALFFVAWIVNLVNLRLLGHRPAACRARRLAVVALLDGTAWGAVGWLLVGFDPALDAWIGAVLCGVSAVNAPVYITHHRAYASLVGAIAGMTVAGAVLGLEGAGTGPYVAGLGIFFVLLLYYMRPVAQRVLEGIELQLGNARLADQLSDALRLVTHEAATDALTGQPNRRALDQLLDEQVAAAATGHVFSVLLLDIDHFKQVNDLHGHGAGDETLRAFARRVRAELRARDTCARYGGEEFVLVMPDTPLAEAVRLAERLRQAVASAPLLDAPRVAATVSIGAAQHAPGEDADALLARADRAVYAAKRGGRDQVRSDDGRPALEAPESEQVSLQDCT